MSFRAASNLTREDYITYELDTNVVLPANGRKQQKKPYTFSVKDTNIWFDWYNAFLAFEYRFENTADGSDVAIAKDGKSSAPINGAFSLIKNLKISSWGREIYSTETENHKLQFIKNLLTYSDDYARSTAKSYFWYLDNDDAVITDKTEAGATNNGIIGRALESNGNKTVKTVVPLNQFSFFEDLDERLLPPMSLKFEIELQDDEEIIWQGDATDRRIVVKTIQLCVPALEFSSEGQKMVSESFLADKKWPYMREYMNVSDGLRVQSGQWKINTLKNLKHAFVFFQPADNLNNFRRNPYFFNTFNLDNQAETAGKLLTCSLKYGSNTVFPKYGYESKNMDLMYRILLNYSYRNNDTNTGVQINKAVYEALYPVIYFDLRNFKGNFTESEMNITFNYMLDKIPTSNYIIHAALICESEIVISNLGKTVVIV